MGAVTVVSATRVTSYRAVTGAVTLLAALRGLLRLLGAVAATSYRVITSLAALGGLLRFLGAVVTKAIPITTNLTWTTSYSINTAVFLLLAAGKELNPGRAVGVSLINVRSGSGSYYGSTGTNLSSPLLYL